MSAPTDPIHNHFAAPGTAPLLRAGLQLLIATALAGFALLSRSWFLVAVCAGCEAVFLLVCRPRLRDVARKFWIFGPQFVLIVGLYILRLGPSPGVISEGARVALQIWLAFLPGIVLYHSLSWAQARRLAHLLLPQQTAFALCTAVTFVPMLLRECREIYRVQLLRGARLRPKDMLSPAGWRDLAHSLLFPTVFQCLKTAHELALAARLRGFPGPARKRIWPYD
ncbi:energy-coupling factor transporter transmembrane component T family protein [Desulfohalobium retbaense]|uniref:Cobalt transport protein n=1 Tax=Desulfohalobium retbaense (strain ATCC 49708 / DSM 5692 / JCM 16813 / HR100) TaxID=485915 RepID=C8X2W5_DESRD|nr:energy-coupling factor transporter transmembrane component T [Desulfohalobium retbaense]ACV68762.1 cobalt transport protein [Desulfohalobium retbaense DSM 5692]